jgi:hypothetical protein
MLQTFLYKLFSIHAESTWMIFVAKNIYVFVPTCASCLVMPIHTSGELIIIFG